MEMRKHKDLTKAEQAARLHHFRRFRANGTPALTAWLDALRHMHFVKELRADVEAHQKRSKAAKRAWKKRKSQMLAA
jgi:hypothetical protein